MSITDLKVQGFSSPNAIASFVASGGIPASVQTGGNVFPIASLGTKTLVVKVSTDGGATYPTTKTHTFSADAVGLTLAALIADIQADATFMSGLTVFPVGTSELGIKTTVSGNRALKVDATSTGIGVALLQFLSGQIGNGSVTTIVDVIQDNNGQYVLFFL